MRQKLRKPTLVLLALAAVTWGASLSQSAAQEAVTLPPGADDSPTGVRSAITRGLAALEKAAKKYPEHRKCFSCHHQALPLLAQATAQRRGASIDTQIVQSQLELTLASFAGRVEELNAGHSIGGAAMTVSYGLWAIALADGQHNATTDAMVSYLLKTQRPEGHWFGQTARPPLEESYQTCTTLAIQGLRRYATDTQREAAEAAIAKAVGWLAAAPAKSQEDKVAKLWGLHFNGAEPEALSAARQAVLAAQRSNGGWAQLDEMDSDAYATGQTLYLLQATGMEANDSACQRGVRFLCRTQRADGNWLVQSRSRPIQPYYDFDDEDPLGKNQFISVPATSWAVTALAHAIKPD